MYGQEVGLFSNQIAIYLATYVVGGAVAQYPVGWAADKYDRRKVLLALSLLATPTTVAAILLADQGPWANYAAIAAFGFATMPIYSISTAHAHDYASSMERVELSAALMFLYAVGAIASPYVASVLIETFGSAAMFVMIAAAHVLLIGFGLARMGVRPSPGNITAYTYEPRTSFLIGRLLGWMRDRT